MTTRALAFNHLESLKNHGSQTPVHTDLCHPG